MKNKNGKKKRPLNEYFTIMLEAKKKNSKQFTYKNKTYYRHVNPKTKLVVYKLKK